MIKIVPISSLKSTDVQSILNRNSGVDSTSIKTTQDILKQIKNKGNSAVLKYAKKYDGIQNNSITISEKTLENQSSLCPPLVQKAILHSIRNVHSFHKNQIEKSWITKADDGVERGQFIRPLKRVGVYVPGGSGVYPSSVIMNIVPAQIAGVSKIVITTPIKDKIDPSVAFAIMSLGIKEVYQIGGVQAIGLLAYGTQTIQPVDKIVGPGNHFVALAKKEVFGVVDIDMIAGPSEILVICSKSADPDWIAADLLSQAEHGSGFEATLCITDDLNHAKFIQECLKQQIQVSPKKELLKHSIKKYGRIFVTKDLDLGCKLANDIAPEHLELITDNNKEWMKHIENAGVIFDGPYSSEPVGDYFAGPNHVLPTHGTARFFSPLGVYDFYKRTNYLKYSQKAILKNGKKIIALAEHEGFIHHADAIRKRL